MMQAALAQQAAKQFGSRNRPRADKYRSSGLVNLFDPFHHGMPFFFERFVDAIGPALPLYGTIGWNARRGKPVYGPDFARDLARGPRHSREPQVSSKETLVADPGQIVDPLGHFAIFFRFDHLVQTVLP